MVTAAADMLLYVDLPMDRVVFEWFSYADGGSSRQDRRRALSFIGIGSILAAAVGAFVQIVS